MQESMGSQAEQGTAQPAATYGAVDLSSMGAGGPGAASMPAPAAASVPAPAAASDGEVRSYLDVPLASTITQDQLDDQLALSRTIPVILLLVSGRSTVSAEAANVVEQQIRLQGGTFVLREIDVDLAPQLAQALQVTSLPTAIALVGGQPVPLFEGVPTAEQVGGLLGELHAAATQMGVTGRVMVSSEEPEPTIPAAHIPALEAQESGEWETAIALWKKVLANNPTDSEAKLALTRAQFEARQQQNDQNEVAAATGSSVLSEADHLFAKMQEEEAYNLLLEAISAESDPQMKEQIRQRLVELFALGSNPDAVRTARMRLSNILLA